MSPSVSFNHHPRELPDVCQRAILIACSPKTFVSLAQVNRSWRDAATPSVVADMLDRVGQAEGRALIDDPDNLERALRRQVRFESIFHARQITLPKPGPFIHDVSFSQKKDELVGQCAGSELLRWDLTDHRSERLHAGVNHYVWNKDRSALVFSEETGSTYYLADVATPQETILDLHLGFADITMGLCFDSQNGVAAAGSWDGHGAAVCISGRWPRAPLLPVGHDVTMYDVAIVGDGNFAIHTGPQYALLLTSLTAPRQTYALPQSWNLDILRPAPGLSPSDAIILDGGVDLIDYATRPIIRSPVISPRYAITDMQPLKETALWVTLGRENACHVWNVSDRQASCLWRRSYRAPLNHIWVAPSHSNFAVGDSLGRIHLRGWDGGACVSFGNLYAAMPYRQRSCDFSEDGEHVLVDGGDHHVVIKRIVRNLDVQALAGADAASYRPRYQSF